MFMKKYSQETYALLRIIAGFMFLLHGSQKLLGFPPMNASPPIHVLVFGGGVEFFGGLLIMLGLWTHWAAFVSAGEMAYAYWTAHAVPALLPLLNRGEMGLAYWIANALKALLPPVNHGEAAMLYCFLFLFFSAYGSGIWSIDELLARRRAT